MSYKYTGLTKEEVEKLVADKKTNVTNKVKGKSHFRIFYESFFTFFNIVLFVVALIFLIFQVSFPDGLKYLPITKYAFLFIILFNGLISVISQEKSKKTLEKMQLIVEPRTLVIRDGKTVEIMSKDIVLGDIVILSSGNEIPCDLVLLEGEISVNESMLTGESNAIIKKAGDNVLCGSFVVSGKAILRAEKVGKDTYISNLESKILKIKKKESKLLKNIYQIITILLICIVPAFICVGLKMFYLGDTLDGGTTHWTFHLNLVAKCGAIIVGMIPTGMILLTSLTLSKSILKMSKQNTMIQELYAVEKLSRVNILCLDKTGTLTTQKFSFVKCVKFLDFNDKELVSSFLYGVKDVNKTIQCLIDQYGVNKKAKIFKYEPFNSDTKQTKIIFENGDIVRIGAFDYVLRHEENIKAARELAKKGYRVLGISKNSRDLGVFCLVDELREGIKDTITYFNNLEIDIKIISGDALETVVDVAKNAGVNNAEKAISMENVPLKEIENLCDKYTIFARTNPEQKQEIIRCLQVKGNVVGYVGDGVNDTISLRQSDCAIALKNGADSTKAVADVVLLDNDFSHLPSVFEEGRRVIHNISRSLLLFCTKSFFVFSLSIVSVFANSGFPIEIEGLYIYEFVITAICGTLLSLQNNSPKPIKEGYIKFVFFKAVGFGILFTVVGLIPLIINRFTYLPHANSIVVILINIVGVLVLMKVCSPFNKYTRTVAFVGLAVSILFEIALPDFFLNPGFLKQATGIKNQFNLLISDFFNFTLYSEFNTACWITLASSVVVAVGLFILTDFLSGLFFKKVGYKFKFIS